MSEELDLKKYTKAGKKRQRAHNQAPAFDTLSKEEQKTVRIATFKRWANAMVTKGSFGNMNQLAYDAGMTMDQLKFYMQKDKWRERLRKIEKKDSRFAAQNRKRAKAKVQQELTDDQKDEIDAIFEKHKLSQRYQLFILYYLHNYDAKWAAAKIGYKIEKSHSMGFNILNRPEVQAAISDIKRMMQSAIYLSAHDIISEYIKIAYADITDFISFDGQSVNLKPSDQVNGQMISEVRQGKDGITFKLHDKMKALERLEKLYEIIPDRRLELETKKFEFQREQVSKIGKETGTRVVIVDDVPIPAKED